MTIRDYLMYIATQPLMLRLTIVVILATVFVVVHAIAERLRKSGQQRHCQPPEDAAGRQPRKVVNVPNFR